MRISFLYDMLKTLGYINPALEDELKLSVQNIDSLILSYLEQDREKVFRTFYGILWEMEYHMAHEAILAGDINYYVQYIT